jgi:hypothetical protein
MAKPTSKFICFVAMVNNPSRYFFSALASALLVVSAAYWAAVIVWRRFVLLPE